jgi:hypothetical protein
MSIGIICTPQIPKRANEITLKDKGGGNMKYALIVSGNTTFWAFIFQN